MYRNTQLIPAFISVYTAVTESCREAKNFDLQKDI